MPQVEVVSFGNRLAILTDITQSLDVNKALAAFWTFTLATDCPFHALPFLVCKVEQDHTVLWRGRQYFFSIFIFLLVDLNFAGCVHDDPFPLGRGSFDSSPPSEFKNFQI